MHRLIGAVTVWAAAASGVVPLSAQQPYQRPLVAEGFSARAIVLPPRRIGETVIREKATLAVEIRVRLRDYLPRDLEPTLLINGQPVPAAIGAVETEGAITTIGFVVEQPDALREGATLAVQMGDATHTRGRVPGVLRRAEIRPLDAGEAQRLGVPPLTEWLRAGTPRPD